MPLRSLVAITFTDAAAAEVLCKAAGATVVIAASTSRWNRVMAGVCQRLGTLCRGNAGFLVLRHVQPEITRAHRRDGKQRDGNQEH